MVIVFASDIVVVIGGGGGDGGGVLGALRDLDMHLRAMLAEVRMLCMHCTALCCDVMCTTCMLCMRCT